LPCRSTGQPWGVLELQQDGPPGSKFTSPPFIINRQSNNCGFEYIALSVLTTSAVHGPPVAAIARPASSDQEMAVIVGRRKRTAHRSNWRVDCRRQRRPDRRRPNGALARIAGKDGAPRSKAKGTPTTRLIRPGNNASDPKPPRDKNSDRTDLPPPQGRAQARWSCRSSTISTRPRSRDRSPCGTSC